MLTFIGFFFFITETVEKTVIFIHAKVSSYTLSSICLLALIKDRLQKLSAFLALGVQSLNKAFLGNFLVDPFLEFFILKF